MSLSRHISKLAKKRKKTLAKEECVRIFLLFFFAPFISHKKFFSSIILQASLAFHP